MDNLYPNNRVGVINGSIRNEYTFIYNKLLFIPCASLGKIVNMLAT